MRDTQLVVTPGILERVETHTILNVDIHLRAAAGDYHV
jgi:hypothetical protein